MKFKKAYLEEIIEKAKEYKAKKVILFGSALENPTNCRDIDLACDMPDLNMFLFAGKLEESLKIPIDIIPINDNDPFLKIVNKYGKVIYES
ncbi:MAG: uncharacterized protein QG635_1016 [Bacteroidota bacterium]|nr:uncharacterized protein [Bacteroidota bacterium]